MGIIEFHFHDAEFGFSPSVSKGSEDDADAESTDSEEVVDWETDAGESDRSPGLGAVVALVVLVALAAVAGLKRRQGSEDDEEVELEA